MFADPQATAREMTVEMPHPSAGSVKLAGTPFKLSMTPAEMRLPPPTLGQHTAEVLGELLGLDDDAIAELRGDKVV